MIDHDSHLMTPHTTILNLQVASLKGKASYRGVITYLLRRAVISVFVYSGVFLAAFLIIARYTAFLSENPAIERAINLKGILTGLVAAIVLVVFLKTETFKTGYIKRTYFYAPVLRRIVNERQDRYQLTPAEAFLLLNYRSDQLFNLEHAIQDIHRGKTEDLPSVQEFGEVLKETRNGYHRLRLFWSAQRGFFIIEQTAMDLADLL